MRSVSLLRYRCGIFFSLSPDPLSPALPDLLASACSPAPWRGRRGLLPICGCGRCGDLSACFLAVPLSRSRSFAIPGRFACGPCCLAVPSMPFRHLPHLPVPRLLADGAMLGSAFCSSRRSAARPASRFPVPPYCPPDGAGLSLIHI